MSTRWRRAPEDELPDVRDGLTRLERAILHELSVEVSAGANERNDVEVSAGANERNDVEVSAGANERNDVEVRAGANERPGGRVPTALLYGRVAEQLDVSIPEFQRALRRLLAR